MFEFYTKSTIARETEKAWGIKPYEYDGIVWLPKSQCKITRQPLKKSEDEIRADLTFRCIDIFGEIRVDLIKEGMELEREKAGLIIEVPDWLAYKKDLVILFHK